MRNIFSEIERTKRAIWLAAILLLTYNVLRLVSIIAAPYPIDQIAHIDSGISIAQYQVTFQNYLDQESQRLEIPPASLKLTILYSGCLAAGYMIFSLFLGMRRKFARYIIMSLVFIEIITDIVFGIKYSILPTKISLIVAFFLLLFLFSQNISKEFK